MGQKKRKSRSYDSSKQTDVASRRRGSWGKPIFDTGLMLPRENEETAEPAVESLPPTASAKKLKLDEGIEIVDTGIPYGNRVWNCDQLETSEKIMCLCCLSGICSRDAVHRTTEKFGCKAQRVSRFASAG